MNKIIFSGFYGDYYKEIASITSPFMEKYAKKHNIEYILYELPLFNRPASWSKIPIMHNLLQKYDLVIWLDSDVLIVNENEDITEQCNDSNIQYLTDHNVLGNNNPNCGVWILKKQMIPYIEQLWKMEKYINNSWWEQAALVEMIGFEVIINPNNTNKVIFKNKDNELYNITKKMHPKWNHSEFNIDKCNNPNFIHFAGEPNRLEQIRIKANKILEN